MNSLRRGIKNAFRNTIRSVGVILILAVAIALAISMLIARDAVAKKIDSVRATTGNTITVSPKGFYGFQGGGTPLTQADMAKVARIPHVVGIRESLGQRLTSTETSLTSPITPGSLGQQFGGSGNGGGFAAGGAGAAGGTFTLPVTVTGTNSPGTALVGGAAGGGTEKLTQGTSFSPTSTADVAIVGSGLASGNNLKIGSTFTAWGTSIKVVGIYNAGSTFANAGVLMPLATVQKLAGLPGQITSVTVVVDSVDNVAAVTTRTTAAIGSMADVTSTQQIVENELAPLNSVKTISTYTLIGAIVAASIILLLSMLMIVRERRREIGVLKAIGAPNRSVIAQFIAETTTFTVLGSVVGLIFGILLSNPITSVLVSSNTASSSGGGPGGGFVGPGGGFGGGGGRFAGGGGGGFRFGGFHSTLTQVHAAASFSTLLAAFAIALLIAVVGSTIAVANVVRIRPADVLRSE
jgi:putative ABC transport system permease protein